MNLPSIITPSLRNVTLTQLQKMFMSLRTCLKICINSAETQIPTECIVYNHNYEKRSGKRKTIKILTKMSIKAIFILLIFKYLEVNRFLYNLCLCLCLCLSLSKGATSLF